LPESSQANQPAGSTTRELPTPFLARIAGPMTAR
jgi:hypothetical protein